MTSEPAPRPFALARHDLADGIWLDPIPAGEATALAARLCAMEPWASYPFAADPMAAYLGQQAAHEPRFVVRQGGQTAGVVCLQLGWLHGPYLRLLAVLDGHQGNGLGGRILCWMEAEARRAGARNLWLCVVDYNAAAHRFYARHGFVEVGTIPGLVRDDRTERLMRKRLG
jgi:diamine N-acetyltransferase